MRQQGGRISVSNCKKKDAIQFIFMQDKLYEGLKGYGLSLSDGVSVGIPHPEPSFLKKIGSYLWRSPKVQQKTCPIILESIFNWGVLAGHALTLAYYGFESEEEATHFPILREPILQTVSSPIKAFHLRHDFSEEKKVEIPFLVQTEDKIIIFTLDPLENRLIERNSISQANPLSIRFICQNEVIILTSQFVLRLFSVRSGRLIEKVNLINAVPLISVDQTLRHCSIAGSIDEQKESIFVIFYLIKNKPLPKKVNRETLKVKEFVRTVDGKIKAKEQIFTVLVTEEANMLPVDFRILTLGEFYCIETHNQIAIVKKKFKKYSILDSITEKNQSRKLKLSESGILYSYDDMYMELSFLQFGDPKCRNRLLDTIDLSERQVSEFRSLWLQKVANETNLILAFQKNTILTFHSMIKRNPLQKVIAAAKDLRKNQLAAAQVNAAVTFGISRCQFYTALWETSNRQFDDLSNFLLNCGDSSVILRQITIIFKREKIAFANVIRILEKLVETIKRELQTTLTEDLLINYMHYEFLKRKIRVMPDQPLGKLEIDEIDNMSILDIFVKIAKSFLILEPPKMVANQNEANIRYQEFNLNLYFGQFRVLILQNYQQFLQQFLARFTTKQIQKVMEEYSSLLLPSCPFSMNLYIYDREYQAESHFKRQQNSFFNSQQPWFSHMDSIEFHREFSTNRVLKQFGEFHPDSKVVNTLHSIEDSQFGRERKLQHHGMLGCSIYQFEDRMKQIEGLKLFFMVFDYVNQKSYQQEGNYLSILTYFFSENNNFKYEEQKKVILFASLHKYMLKHNLMQRLSSQDRNSYALMSISKQQLLSIIFSCEQVQLEGALQDLKNMLQKAACDHQAILLEWLQLFIKSNKCTLDLLCSLLKVTAQTPQTQADNKKIIQLIYDGFLHKTKLTETQKAEKFTKEFERMQIHSFNLQQKHERYLKIKDAMDILITFSLQDMTIEQYFNSVQSYQIYELLLQKFFKDELKKQQVTIEGQHISMEFGRNMLTIVMYIHEMFQQQIDESLNKLLIIYGKKVIEWKQYQIMRGIIFQEDMPYKLGLQTDQYLSQLIQTILKQIFQEIDTIYDQEVEEHLQSILSLLPDNHALKNKYIAKIKLIHIFKEWSIYIYLHDIEGLSNNWLFQSDRTSTINAFLDLYINQITFKILIEIIILLNQISQELTGSEAEMIRYRGRENIGYFQDMIEAFIKNDKINDCSEIIAYILKMEDFPYDQELVNEVFLKIISISFTEIEQLQGGKKLIQYYTQNLHNRKILQQLFQSELASGRFNEQNPRESALTVKKSLCLNQVNLTVELDLLWNIALEAIQEQRNSFKFNFNFTQEVYYSYYFLIQGLKNPAVELRFLYNIQYNYEILGCLIDRFINTVEQHPELDQILLNQVLQLFENGLIMVGCFRMRGSVKQRMKNMVNVTVESVTETMKGDKTKYKDLLASMQKVQRRKIVYNYTWMTKQEEKYNRLAQQEYEKQNALAAVAEKAQVEQIQRVKLENRIKKYRLFSSVKKQESKQKIQSQKQWEDVRQSQIDKKRQEKQGQRAVHRLLLAQNYGKIDEIKMQKQQMLRKNQQNQQKQSEQKQQNVLKIQLSNEKLPMNQLFDICRRFKGQRQLKKDFKRILNPILSRLIRKGQLMGKLLAGCEGNKQAQLMVMDAMMNIEQKEDNPWI